MDIISCYLKAYSTIFLETFINSNCNVFFLQVKFLLHPTTSVKCQKKVRVIFTELEVFI